MFSLYLCCHILACCGLVCVLAVNTSVEFLAVLWHNWGCCKQMRTANKCVRSLGLVCLKVPGFSSQSKLGTGYLTPYFLDLGLCNNTFCPPSLVMCTSPSLRLRQRSCKHWPQFVWWYRRRDFCEANSKHSMLGDDNSAYVAGFSIICLLLIRLC